MKITWIGKCRMLKKVELEKRYRQQSEVAQRCLSNDEEYEVSSVTCKTGL